MDSVIGLVAGDTILSPASLYCFSGAYFVFSDSYLFITKLLDKLLCVFLSLGARRKILSTATSLGWNCEPFTS